MAECSTKLNLHEIVLGSKPKKNSLIKNLSAFGEVPSGNIAQEIMMQLALETIARRKAEAQKTVIERVTKDPLFLARVQTIRRGTLH